MTINLRDLVHNVHGRLFQAAMWRKTATYWDKPETGIYSWVKHVLQKPREECLRRARINVMLARRLNRREKRQAVGVER